LTNDNLGKSRPPFQGGALLYLTMKQSQLRRPWLVLVCFIVLGRFFCAAAIERSIEYRLTDYLDHDWTAELISFPVSFEQGACREIGSVTADHKPVPFQTPAAEITRHPDQSLATARVYVLTDLKPRQTILFRVTGSMDPKPPARLNPDLRVTEADSQVTIESAAAGVRLPLGTFAGGEPVPAPYEGFRLTTGRWVGSSRLMGEPGPERLVATVTERGPLFAEVVLSYDYPQDRSFTLRCRVIAGQPVALFTEESNLEPGCGYHRNLNYDYKRFVQGRYGYSEAFEKSHWLRVNLGDFTPAIDRSGDSWHATLFPWGSWHGGSMTVPLADDSEYLGLMALRAGHWRRPLENLGLVRIAGEEIYLQLPINDGRREWGIHFGPVTSMNPAGEEPPKEIYPGLRHPSLLQLALIKYGQLSLDVVKDWQLAWKDRQEVPSPITINPPGKVQTVRQRIAADPVLSAHAKKVEAHWDRFRKEPDFPFTTWWIMNPEGVEDVYLASGKKEHARELYELALGRLRFYSAQTLSGVGFTGYRYGHGYGMFHLAHVLIGTARQVDLLLGSPHINEQEKEALRAQLSFFAFLFMDPDYWPMNEIPKGPYDMIAARDNSVGFIGAVLGGHPQAREWLRVAEKRIDDIISHYIHPSGAMKEGTHYSGVTMDFTLPVMAAMKLSGGEDYFQDARLKRGFHWYAALLPPVDKRFGFAYMPPFGYSHPTGTSMSVRWAVMAAMTARSDQEFAGLMMRTWRQQGSPMRFVVGEAGYQSAFSLGLIDPAMPEPKDPGLASEKWEGFGAVLRNHAGSPLETFMALPTGAPDGFRAYPNEGAFHLYAKGAPLCLRFGARGYNDTVTQSAWMNNRITFDKRDESQSGTGLIRQWVSLSTADFFGGEYRITRLRGKPVPAATDRGNLELSEPRVVDTKETGSVISSFFGDEQDVPPQTWRRQILFVKDQAPRGPNYFLLSDSFAATLPTDWNLWCLANEMKMDGAKATFSGKFEVDLDVYLLQNPGKIVTGAWGPEKERQKLLQLQQDANQGYFVALYPRAKDEPVPVLSRISGGKGLSVSLPNRTDWAFLSAERFEFEEADLQFSGSAGVAQRGESWIRLTLLDGERIALGGLAVRNPEQGGKGAFALSATSATQIILEGESDGEARPIMFRIPPEWKALSRITVDGQIVVFSRDSDDWYLLPLPSGRCQIQFSTD
jgi:hypothetical protein